MVVNTSSVDFDLFFKTLRRAARHIAAELNLEILYAHALEILSDFSHSKYLSILLLNENLQTVSLVAKQVDGKYERLSIEIPLPEFLQEAIESRKPVVKDIQPNQHCYFLNIEIPPDINRVTCLPLIGTQDKLLGFITFLSSSEFQLEKFQEESLTILTTLIATTIDNANLFQLATLDGLTGLFARRYFDLRLQEEVTRLRRQPGDLALIMLDIDLFKIVNDTYGHQEGDHVLRELANIIRSTLRQNLDIPCRYGGEEFAIILPGTGSEGAVILAERMRRKCENYPFDVGSKIIQVTISAGIATMSNNRWLTKDELVKIADDNLYAAKRSGRNCVRL